jgi:hypothetical protein
MQDQNYYYKSTSKLKYSTLCNQYQSTPMIEFYRYHRYELLYPDKPSIESLIVEPDKMTEEIRKEIRAMETIIESMSGSNLIKKFDEIDEDESRLLNSNENNEYGQSSQMTFKDMNCPIFRQTFEKEIVWTSND